MRESTRGNPDDSLRLRIPSPASTYSTPLLNETAGHATHTRTRHGGWGAASEATPSPAGDLAHALRRLSVCKMTLARPARKSTAEGVE